MAQLSGSGTRLVVRRGPFDGVKVFSATMAPDRGRLGERITEWIQAHPDCELTEIVVTQSSDAAFHCLAFIVFFRERGLAR
ncbi:MAG TPA: hypothetical protein VK932_11985 [Kofleriaceae bacterium]|nr:hypothetical protein [Kofleriaceae bacterium]